MTNKEGKQLQVVAGTKRPPGRPPKHGLYSKFVLAPLTDDMRKQVIEIVSGQRLAIAPSDQIVINLLARVLAQIELMGRWLSEHGLFQDDADGKSRGAVSPLVTQYLSAIKVASRLCDQMGLSPEARVKLGKGIAQVEDIASKIQRAKEA